MSEIVTVVPALRSGAGDVLDGGGHGPLWMLTRVWTSRYDVAPSHHPAYARASGRCFDPCPALPGLFRCTGRRPAFQRC